MIEGEDWYKFKTEPYEHQSKGFYETRDLKSYAVFWEQGLGKTKLILDTVAWLYMNGKIDALLVVAPNGVHRNWIAEELEVHLPDEVLEHTKSFAYDAVKAKNKSHKAGCEEVLLHNGLSILAISYSGFCTDAGMKYAKKFLTRRRAFYVLDESAYIKNPISKRTRTIQKSAKYAEYRRILTGTPVANGPFDVFAQMRWLDADFWKPRGLHRFSVFKSFFAKWGQGFNHAANRTYKVLECYQNLDVMKEIISGVSSRLLKEDCLDLPPKIFSKRFFKMSSKQAKMYKQLKEEYYLEFEAGDVTADLAMVRMLRLQQIACGYVSMDDVGDGKDRIMIDIDDKNRRLDLLKEILEELPHKAIIWARFTSDIDKICEMLGDEAIRYDGKVTDPAERTRRIADFQRGEPRFFVANPMACATGITLTAAQTVVYYSNTFKLTDRLQSEDRAHRIGQEHPVQYLDLVAEGTVDEYIVKKLREKKGVADQITGDSYKEWL